MYIEREVIAVLVTCCYILFHAWWICGLAKDPIYTEPGVPDAFICHALLLIPLGIKTGGCLHQKSSEDMSAKIHKGLQFNPSSTNLKHGWASYGLCVTACHGWFLYINVNIFIHALDLRHVGLLNFRHMYIYIYTYTISTWTNYNRYHRHWRVVAIHIHITKGAPCSAPCTLTVLISVYVHGSAATAPFSVTPALEQQRAAHHPSLCWKHDICLNVLVKK